MKPSKQDLVFLSKLLMLLWYLVVTAGRAIADRPVEHITVDSSFDRVKKQIQNHLKDLEKHLDA